MTIRPYRPGDEDAQVAIYNTAAATLPRFKPATVFEVQRRVRSADFDPQTRFYAEAGGQVVGYCTLQLNGRISFPWTLPGHEGVRDALFTAALEHLRSRGVERAFAAYRSDWGPINSYLEQHGFARVRDMVNFVLPFADMPTPAARGGQQIGPLTPADVPAVFSLAPDVVTVRTPAELHRYLFENPYFGPDALFALRSREQNVLAVGLLITEPTYADPQAIDPLMPCFRLGAFGTEGQATKRVRGLFSFLARADKSVPSLGIDLLGHAVSRLGASDEITCFAAQARSDTPALVSFYRSHFRTQGSFPVFERPLA